jgi:hypothetical protein
VAALLVPAAAAFGRLSPAVMVSAGIVIGILNAVSGPLNASLLGLVGDRRDQRSPGRGSARAGTGAARFLAIQETAVKVAMTAAPLAALPLVAVVGATWTVAIEGFLTLVAAALIASLRLCIQHDPSEPVPRVRALLRRHPEIAAGWTVRGVGCAAWFAFTLCLPVLGHDRGDGVVRESAG